MRQRVKIVIKEEIVRELYAIAGEDAVQIAEPMKNHTTFRVGGPADYFVAPHTEEEIRKIVALCESKWKETESGRKPEACLYPSARRQEKPVFPVWSLPPESLEL